MQQNVGLLMMRRMETLVTQQCLAQIEPYPYVSFSSVFCEKAAICWFTSMLAVSGCDGCHLQSHQRVMRER